MNFLQRVIWLARRNFIRGFCSNIAAIFLVAVSNLVFFVFFLFNQQPNLKFIKQYASFLWVIELLFSVILFVSFIALIFIFYLTNKVRYHEIGLLRGIGANRKFIFFMILFEVLFIVFVGVLLAILAAFIISLIAKENISQFFTLANGFSGALQIFISLLLSFLSTVIIATLAALYPSVLICGIEPYSAIRNRE